MTDAAAGGVYEYVLDASEQQRFDSIIGSLPRTPDFTETPEFHQEARLYAYSYLPKRLTRILTRFGQGRTEPVLLVRGLSTNDALIGDTPSHWKQSDRLRTFREECFMILVASLLGEVFAWSTLQEGNLIHNVVPIRGQEYEQSGHSSLGDLAWHTEDAFHAYRCDYLCLMGIRNVDRVPTQVAAIDSIQLSLEQRMILFEPRFIIKPDKEHLYQAYRERKAKEAHNEALLREWTRPPPVAVLFGDLEHPYLRIDPTFMTTVAGDSAAQAALDAVTRALQAALQDVVIDAGSLMILDNQRVVHGRVAFEPRYDGSDRWLKKMLVTRDLRKSWAVRLDREKPLLRPTSVPEMPARAQASQDQLSEGSLAMHDGLV